MDQRRGLDMWGPLGRWIFLNWPRGSWQYDLICGAIIVGLFVFPNPEPPQSLDLEGVLAAIEAADARVVAYTAEMVRTERVVLFDDEERESGTIAFLKPGYLRIEMAAPSSETIVIGQDEATHYLPRIKQARVTALDSEAVFAEYAIPGLASSARIRGQYDVSLEQTQSGGSHGPTIYVLRLVPNAGTEAAKRWKTVTLDVAEGEWYPARRIVLEEHHGDTTTIDLSAVDRDARLSPADFRLELPDDVEIIRQTAAKP